MKEIKNYIFRLQSDEEISNLSNNISFWGDSIMYDDTQINAIKSTNPDTYHQPTSIPSPFARIALVKTAFSEVARNGDKALKAYQKIVSDCLDIGQIFFRLDDFINEVEIIVWDKNQDLMNLQRISPYLYKTFKVYLEKDASLYNFDMMDKIFLLKHRKSAEIIGATSPITLFLSSGNNLNNINLNLGGRTAFREIKHLKKRDFEFQKFLYAWFSKYNDWIDKYNRSLFNEFSKYLDTQKNGNPYIELIDKINPQTLEDEIQSKNYEKITFNKGNYIYYVEILPDKPLYKFSPYDFLEDHILVLDYRINNSSYFDGNIGNTVNKGCLLPIKDRFFEKFKVEDLKDKLKIIPEENFVRVELEINKNTKVWKDYKRSDNTIINVDFDCALFPNVKFNNETKPNYRFGIVCFFDKKDYFDVDFYKEDKTTRLNEKQLSVRNVTNSSLVNRQLKNYIIEKNFDYIRIKYENYSGIIIPNFQKTSELNEYIFAVDIGTTNTHIEYKGVKEISFDIKENEKQIHFLHGQADLWKKYFIEEYIPEVTDEEFKFPMRTALSYGEDISWIQAKPFEKANINVLFEKRYGLPYNKTITDLKWSTDTEFKNQIRVYIESIMFLIRNKVLLNNGNLSKTKIIWFYPISMERTRFENFESEWRRAYKEYFLMLDSEDINNVNSEDINNVISNNVIPITESIAPFEYYIKDGNAGSLVTIDIGGETSDIVLGKDNEAKYITSFRFAANAVFGDGYSTNKRIRNGIVEQFLPQIKQELEELSKNIDNKDIIDNILNILDDMKENRNSSDIASFLFSLNDNKGIQKYDQSKSCNLTAKLRADQSQKIIFIIFYSAIIYHLAKIMNSLEFDIPDKIVFSGNGSRVIGFISIDEDIIKEYTNLIIKYIIKSEKKVDEVIFNIENPKEATCKGGLYSSNKYDFESINNKKVILHSNNTNKIIKMEKINGDTYEAIDDTYKSETVNEVYEFLSFVFNNLKFFSKKGFILDHNSIEIGKKVCLNENRIRKYLDIGLSSKLESVSKEELLNESLFFYPLKGILFDLSREIYKKQKN